MLKIYLKIDTAWAPVCLKLEGCNPAGSSKDRPAIALITDLEKKGLLNSSSTIVESTSGNLGVALAYFARELGYSFMAVIDPKMTFEIRRRMTELAPNWNWWRNRMKRVSICSCACAEFVNYATAPPATSGLTSIPVKLIRERITIQWRRKFTARCQDAWTQFLSAFPQVKHWQGSASIFGRSARLRRSLASMPTAL